MEGLSLKRIDIDLYIYIYIYIGHDRSVGVCFAREMTARIGEYRHVAFSPHFTVDGARVSHHLVLVFATTVIWRCEQAGGHIPSFSK